MKKKQKNRLIRILVTAALLILLRLLPVTGILLPVSYLAVYVLIGHDILRKAWKGLRNGSAFDENFLMAAASLGAFALAFARGTGDYTESVFVMLFYQVGVLFESVAVGKSRRSITELMDIRPDFARLLTDGTAELVDPASVRPGSEIEVRPGEKIPLDGVVTGGSASLNTAALTGESRPRDVGPEDAVVSGCINTNGVLRIRTTKEFGESTVSRILELVENASSRKSRSESFLSRFAAVYTPAVCGAALLLAAAVPGIRLLTGRAALWTEWIYRALTFLVVSCPCALVISIPLSFFAGIGGASRKGILIKGSNYLEALADTDCVVFDKTGTLTEGSFTVEEICPKGMEKEQLLEIAALAECTSSHPVGLSILRAYGREPDRSRVSEITETGGEGITARVDGRQIAVGNRKLMERCGIRLPAEEDGGTAVHVAADGVYAGCIRAEDTLKRSAPKAVALLRSAGVKRIVMLTGDTREAAEKAAKRLGITEVHAGLLPQDKVAELEKILGGRTGRGRTAFVGDGINDAPVLSRADVGIAMGTLGSDAAIEAADVVLMDDDPLRIVKAIRIAGRCLAIVRENIVFSLGVKFVCLALTAAGLAGMRLAVFADVGVMVLAVLNAMRALRSR